MKRSDSKYASRYAKAVFELACERKILEPVNDDMEKLGLIFSENPVLRKAMSSFTVSHDIRLAVLEEISEKAGFHEIIRSFLALTVRNRRAALIPCVVEEFSKQYMEHHNIRKVDVVSAAELTAADKKAIKDVLKKNAGFDSVIGTTVDSSLLGGLVVTYRSRRLDDSVKTKLERLKKTMKGTA